MIDIRGKRALVMGLGVHGGGLGVARFLVGQGADVTVTDLRGPEALKPSLDALVGLPIRYVLGAHHDDDFGTADLVIRNPGVPRESRYLQIARAAGAVIEMEMTLFFRLCPGPILGITGTKGKTTTTLLAGAMLRQQYPDTVVAGNLRVSALEALPHITTGTPVVLELSSWQLEGLGEARLSPAYACVTNLSPDHLNRYGGMAEYAEAKRQIFRWQGSDGIAVLNGDDAEVASWAAEAPGTVIWFGARPNEAESSPQSSVFYDSAGLWWSSQKAGKRHIQHLCTLEDIPLAGQHNLANVAAAAALVKSFGSANRAIEIAIREFGGVPHRLELIRELDGVRYINDTAATAPEAAIAALHSFTAPIVLIAGGADKQLPLDRLARAIVEKAKAVILLDGAATPRLQRELSLINEELKKESDAGRFPTRNSQFSIAYDDFAQAIEAARAMAEPGDVVLLSPGCASFGMFLNEFHRGDEFRRIVDQL